MSLSRLEIAMFLRTVELFRHCTTAQLIRIAEIAQQDEVDQGERIYGSNEPAAAMFCVVEGKVELDPPEANLVVAGPREAFGIREILCDVLRSGEAKAATRSHLLVIESDDLLDLLSNNIEIVRSLFRQLLSHSEGRPARSIDP